MRILLTNDDGVHAEGLRCLASELRKYHDVCILAPDQERSGVSHAMSLRNPGKIRMLADAEYSCSGTPVDCVILAGLGAIPFIPEVVVAGINRGPNLGTDIVYSGTCGAARQASLLGLPAVAISCASFKEPLNYGAAAIFVRRNLEKLVNRCRPGIFLNVNAPSSSSENLPGRWANPSSRRYLDKLQSFDGPDGYSYCFLADTNIETKPESGSDHDVVSMGEVSVTPILIDPQIASDVIALPWAYGAS